MSRQIVDVIRRTVLVSAVVLALTPTFSGQTSVGTLAIRGVVVDADTGGPLRRARITLRRSRP
jgi:hypothetical protein